MVRKNNDLHPLHHQESQEEEKVTRTADSFSMMYGGKDSRGALSKSFLTHDDSSINLDFDDAYRSPFANFEKAPADKRKPLKKYAKVHAAAEVAPKLFEFNPVEASFNYCNNLD